MPASPIRLCQSYGLTPPFVRVYVFVLPVRQVANGQWGGKKTAAKPASKTLYQLAASKPKGPAAAILQMIGSSSLE